MPKTKRHVIALVLWASAFLVWILVNTSLGGFEGQAAASTGTGIETAMTNLTNLVIAICGLGVVLGIGWKGLQFAIMQDWRHAGESLIGVGLGGGMVAFARPIGAFIMGAALAQPLHRVVPYASGDVVGDMVGLLLAYAPTIALGVVWGKGRLHAK